MCRQRIGQMSCLRRSVQRSLSSIIPMMQPLDSQEMLREHLWIPGCWEYHRHFEATLLKYCKRMAVKVMAWCFRWRAGRTTSIWEQVYELLILAFVFCSLLSVRIVGSQARERISGCAAERRRGTARLCRAGCSLGREPRAARRRICLAFKWPEVDWMPGRQQETLSVGTNWGALASFSQMHDSSL